MHTDPQVIDFKNIKKEALLSVPSKISAIFSKYRYYNPNKWYWKEDDGRTQSNLSPQTTLQRKQRFIESYKSLRQSIENDESNIVKEPTTQRKRLPMLTKRKSLCNKDELVNIKSNRINAIAGMGNEYKEYLMKCLYKNVDRKTKKVQNVKIALISSNSKANTSRLKIKKSPNLCRKKAFNGTIPIKEKQYLYLKGLKSEEPIKQKIERNIQNFMELLENETTTNDAPDVLTTRHSGNYFSYQQSYTEDLNKFEYELPVLSMDKFNKVIM